MTAWPPRYESTFQIRETGIPPHSVALVREIKSRFPNASKLSKNEMFSLQWTLYWIDEKASWAAAHLEKSHWTFEDLLSLPTPQLFGFDDWRGAHRSRKYREWLRFHEHALCIEECRKARDAILAGAFLEAVLPAFYAGEHSNGALALSARFSAEGRIHKKGVLTKRQVQSRANQIAIIAIARELRGRHPSWSTSDIAREIDKRHRISPGFPRFERIRQILRDKSWERRPNITNHG